jgi:hypothetical protein
MLRFVLIRRALSQLLSANEVYQKELQGFIHGVALPVLRFH